MTDQRLQNLAQLLVRYCVAAKPGDDVAIRCNGSLAAALPLMGLVFRETLKAGANPHPMILPGLTEEFEHIFLSEGSDEQLGRADPAYALIAHNFQCDIRILSEVNTRRLSRVDPSRTPMHLGAQSELMRLYRERAARQDLRWVLSGLPTTGYAQDSDMSLGEFEEFVFSATFADLPDPASAWREMSARQARLVDWLRGKSQVEVKGKHVDLTFSTVGRSFISCDGHANMPDGEIYTGPVEDSVNGWVESSFPAIYLGVDFGRVTIKLEGGVVVEAEAEKNKDRFTKLLETDEGARRLGEFGIGTNRQIQTFTKNMLFDEKIGGTIHAALGAGYPETGATNHSAIHWDLLCDMRDGGQIIVDGQLFYDSGKFLV
jgi:aminopeptidase